MDISIEEESGIAITTIGGAKYGDPLTDNRYEDEATASMTSAISPMPVFSDGLLR